MNDNFICHIHNIHIIRIMRRLKAAVVWTSGACQKHDTFLHAFACCKSCFREHFPPTQQRLQRNMKSLDFRFSTALLPPSQPKFNELYTMQNVYLVVVRARSTKTCQRLTERMYEAIRINIHLISLILTNPSLSLSFWLLLLLYTSLLTHHALIVTACRKHL